MQGNERRGPGPRLPPVDRWMPLLCSFILAAAWGQMNFTGDQVLRILAKDEKQLSLFRDLENLKTQKLDFWRGPARPSLPVDMRVSFPELDDIRAYLESHGLVYSIMIKNIQELLDKEREAMVKACRLECSTSSFSYSSYHTLEEIYSWIDNFVTEHSDIISKIHISNSFENQSILVLKIVSEYGKDRVLTDILKVMDVFIELVTNPDGFAFTHSMSEPEVATIVDFVTGHGNFKALISIHSYSQMLMYPYGHSVEPISNQKELYSLAKDAVKALYKVHRSKYIFGSISTTLYVASGVTVDWAYDSGIKYAFTFELRDTGCYGFLLPAAQIIPMAQETWVAMRTIMEHTLNHPY